MKLSTACVNDTKAYGVTTVFGISTGSIHFHGQVFQLIRYFFLCIEKGAQVQYATSLPFSNESRFQIQLCSYVYIVENAN